MAARARTQPSVVVRLNREEPSVLVGKPVAILLAAVSRRAPRITLRWLANWPPVRTWQHLKHGGARTATCCTCTVHCTYKQLGFYSSPGQLQ